MMKVKNVSGRSINVLWIPRQDGEEFEADDKCQEIKNLILHKYLEKVGK